MIERLVVPAELLAQIEAEARAAFPRECCGLLVGQRNRAAVEVFLAHPAANIADCDDRFEIDPQAQFTLLRALRGTGRQIVGCYHSHPNGRAAPSPRDRAQATESNFVWLIAAVDAPGGCTAKAFLFDGRSFRPLELYERPGQSPRC